MEVRARWPLAPCKEPSGLAIDRKIPATLFWLRQQDDGRGGCHSGKVIATPAIGEGVDATAFDGETGLAFASCGEDGVLTVVKEESADKFTTVENVKTQEGARTMALDSKTHNVFVVTAKFGPPPAPTANNPHPWPSVVPEYFCCAGRW